MNTLAPVRVLPPLAVCSLLGALTLAVGCGKSEATVEGNVTYKGKVVRGGQIKFHDSSGKGVGPMALIDAKGHYTVTAVPIGKWKMTVDTEIMRLKSSTPSMKLKPPPGMKVEAAPNPTGEDLGGYDRIPGKYRNANSTPLEINVESGTTKKDLALTD